MIGMGVGSAMQKFGAPCRNFFLHGALDEWFRYGPHWGRGRLQLGDDAYLCSADKLDDVADEGTVGYLLLYLVYCVK